MSRKRATTSRQSANSDEPDEEYLNKRKRNNEAVLKSRMKSRQKEQITMQRVDELREENAELERKVEGLNKELAFLKDMFVAYAAGNKKGKGETNPSAGDFDAEQIMPSTSTGRSAKKAPAKKPGPVPKKKTRQ